MHFSLGEAPRVTAVWSSWLQDGDNLEHSTVLSVTFRVPVDWIEDAVGNHGECSSSKAALYMKQVLWFVGI